MSIIYITASKRYANFMNMHLKINKKLFLTVMPWNHFWFPKGPFTLRVLWMLKFFLWRRPKWFLYRASLYRASLRNYGLKYKSSKRPTSECRPFPPLDVSEKVATVGHLRWIVGEFKRKGNELSHTAVSQRALRPSHIQTIVFSKLKQRCQKSQECFCV